MKRNASLKDIAKEVGVSTALVSYVLNGKEKEARVGKEIASVIRETAKKLNYQPNQIAKSLKSGKSNTIGLVLADISNPFFANIARIIEDEAKKSGYTVIFGSSDESSSKSWDLIRLLSERQVDGFIIAPSKDSSEQMEYLASQNIPFVLIDRYFPEIETNYVVTDNYQASFNAVSHLIETGHKKIGLVVYKSSMTHMQDRKRGYLDALNTHQITPEEPWIIDVDFKNIDECSEKLSILLKKRSTLDALFFATNTLSMYGLKALNRFNYKVPEDIAVVGFDESDAFDFFYCPITFISQPILSVGKQAVNILLKQVSGKQKAKKKLVISSKLVIRKSCGINSKSA